MSHATLLSRRNRRRTTRSVFLESLEQRLLLAADLQNPSNPLDVSGDGYVSPTDPLLIINHLTTGRVSSRSIASAGASPPYLDVDGDDTISAADAQLVIGSLQQPTSIAQASSAASASSTIDRGDLTNVDAETQVQYSGIYHNRRTRQSKTNVTVTNTSAAPIDTPLILVIESISNPTVSVANADGTTTPDGKPYFDLTGQVPGDQLDPGESTNNRPLVFNNPTLRPFTIQASVYRQEVTPDVPSVTLEIPADEFGAKSSACPMASS